VIECARFQAEHRGYLTVAPIQALEDWMIGLSIPRVALCLLTLLVAVGCHDSEKTPHNTNGVPAVASQSKSKAIVFIHGIYGDGQSTWMADDGKTYWPDLVTHDPQFGDADVVVRSYKTSLLGNSSTVQTIAATLRADLADVFSSHKEVIFLCHSLGGLIVKQLLLDNPQYAEKVPFMVFYATPGGGSFVARFASVFSDDPLLQAMSNAGDKKYLLDLENRWRSAHFSIHRYCAYELQKMRPHDLRAIVVGGTANARDKLLDFVGGIYVVDPISATYACDDSAAFTGINANHVEIVKPLHQVDDSYTLFAKYYAAHGATQQANAQPVRFDKTLCAFYGEAKQGSNAWNKDEICPISDRDKLDAEFHQGDFHCCGGGAASTMSNASIPPGLEVKVDGGHYWSVDRGALDGDTYRLHTYCGPEPPPGPGCNVKVKIVGHYKVIPPDNANPPR
jgi:pimeloyl-ACP methyl ester carboxylesterase